MLNVKQISAKYKISRVSVYKHLNELNTDGHFDKYIIKQHNKLYLKQPLIKNIVDSFDKSHINGKPKGKYISYSKYIQHLEAENKRLNDRLTEADKNIHDNSKRFAKLLSQQQQLQLSSENENKHLRGKIKHLKEIKGTVTKSSDIQKHPVKRGFWARLFGK